MIRSFNFLLQEMGEALHRYIIFIDFDFSIYISPFLKMFLLTFRI